MQNDIRRRERERLESMSREELEAIALDLLSTAPSEVIEAALRAAFCKEGA